MDVLQLEALMGVLKFIKVMKKFELSNNNLVILIY